MILVTPSCDRRMNSAHLCRLKIPQRTVEVQQHPKEIRIFADGYLPLSNGGANLFFQLVNARCEKGAAAGPVLGAGYQDF